MKVEGFRYGKTLLEALGVADQKVIIRESSDNGTVTWGKASYTAGENISCTITANEGYFIDAVFVNGCDVTALIGADGTLTLNGFTAAELDLNAVFVAAENLATVDGGRRLGCGRARSDVIARRLCGRNGHC